MGRKGRTKFPKPYTKYHEDPDLCQKVKNKYFKLKKDPIFNPRKIVSTITEDHNVKPTALRYWIKKWDKDISWNPFDTKNKGVCHRIFTDSQEQNMMDYIEDNYINTNGYFSNAQFQTLAFEAYDNIYKNVEKPPNFNCSKHFISDFKNKFNVSSRLAHFKERKENYTQNNAEEDIELFKATIKSVIEDANQKGEPVINADETGFQILPNSIKTWAYKGSKNVSIDTKDNSKERISVMASISSNMCKLPLFIIGQGYCIENALEQCGEPIEPNKLSFSAKSYMTSTCFMEYLEFLRSLYPSNTKIHLIIDSYSTHTPQKCKDKANDLNIELYYIPSGMTDILQPLDVAIFGPLKESTNSKIRNLLFGNQNQKVGMQNTVRFIQESYESLSIDALVNAWEQYL